MSEKWLQGLNNIYTRVQPDGVQQWGHLIKQATPRRPSIALKDLQADCSSNVSALARKVGRPTRKEAAAKQLIFTTSTNKHTWQYLNRNKKDKVGKLKKKREHWARVV